MTHHGRPGGRALELLIMFALIGLSAAILVGGVALGVWVYVLLLTFVDPILVIAASGLMLPYVWKPIMRCAWWLAATIWTPFMDYYGYEPHTFKQIKPKEDDQK